MVNHAFCSDQAGASAIDPKANEILKHMGDYLKSANQYTFRAHSTFEKVSPSGQKIQYGETQDVSVRRPDRLHAVIQGDLVSNRFWYDGKSMAMLDTRLNIFATTETPTDIDSTLVFAANKYGITAPLGDLVISDPYTSLIENVKSGTYVGLHTIDGVKCHHLAFTQENIDWQIWIEEGRMQVPRKVVITYKHAEGMPQYTSQLLEWNFSPHLPDTVFAFVVPVNAEEIEFLPIESKVPVNVN
jgi:hypothetical protein